MCIITILPPGVTLTQAQVVDAMSKNAHGVGIMYSQNGRLYTGRTMTSNPGKVRRWLNRAPSDLERIVHFRKSTAGAVNRANLHPFEVHGRFGVMHNGTLSDSLAETSRTDPRSDTSIFVNETLGEMEPEMLTNSAVWKLIEAAADDNRIIMLDGETGELRWTADHLWTEGVNGIQMSNTYSIESGEVWGVQKKTYWQFFNKGYSYGNYGSYRGMYGSYGNSRYGDDIDDDLDDDDDAYTKWLKQRNPPVSTTTTTPLYTPPAHVNLTARPASTPSQLKLAYERPTDSDEDVMKGVYMMHISGSQVPSSLKGTCHPWYSACLRLYQGVTSVHKYLSPCTLLVAFIHGGMKTDDVEKMTADRAAVLVTRLLEFVKLAETPHYALMQAFRAKQPKEHHA